MFGEEEYDTLDGYLSEEVRRVFGVAEMGMAREFVSPDWGEFRSMGNIYMTEISEKGKSYAVVQVNVSFEKVSVVFTLTFNEAMEIDGFYVK